MSEHRHARRDEQRLEDIAGVDESDIDEAHDPDDSMERAGKSHHTKEELDLPPDSPADPDDERPPPNQ